MSLQVFDSLSKTKRLFKPVVAGKVGIYACGVTVYDYCHIGHARAAVVFDTITRYLRMQGFEVTYVKNITDIDDKIIKRAAENGETVEALVARFIQAMHEDERALGIQPPDFEPRATEHMVQIIQLIEELMAKGFAYITDNGDVCFAVRKFDEYGKLSNRQLDELIAGARVQVEAGKNDPLDFVLWKAAKSGEPAWPAPWGDGRPGWHIECSAMATDKLGQPFDIHGGGLDLKFPHHENEVAQSEAAMGKPLANYWMHVGLLQVNGEKMSKSLNNFFTIRDVLKKYHLEEVRYFMLSSHYRSPVNYSEENLQAVHQSLRTLYTALRGLPSITEKNTENFVEKFIHAMDDDFNTPVAFSVLFEMAREVNRLRLQEGELNRAAEIAAGLKRLAAVFGLLQVDPDTYLQAGGDIDEQVAKLIHNRETARENKNWQQADQIRDQLKSMGVLIEDGAGGTTWRRV